MTGVYLDYAASTPVDPMVFKAMEPYYSLKFGNPGSVHAWGREAQAALDTGRKTVADLFGVDFGDTIFVSSATEANNLMIQGAVRQYRKSGLGKDRGLPHIITSTIEHESVLAVCQDLEQSGSARITYIPVDYQGFVNPADVADALSDNTLLVSVMYVNNVTGAIQPLREISNIIKGFKKTKLSPQHHSQYTPRELLYPIFHTDAAQAMHSLEKIKCGELGVDAITASSHKTYGPKGAGVLIMDFPVNLGLDHCLIGGLQEFGMRASTQDVSSIVGLAKALELIRTGINQEIKHAKELRKILVQGVIKAYPRAVINSYPPYIDGLCNISFPGFGLEDLLYRFDRQDIAVAAGSACSAKALKPSHVLTAMGLPGEIVNSAVRFSFGKYVSRDDMLSCVKKLPQVFG